MTPLPRRWQWLRSAPLFLLIVWLAVPFYLGLALGHNVARWQQGTEIAARYALGAPGAFAAAWGLRRQAKRRLLPLEFPAIYNLLRVAGAALLFYVVLGGLVVPPGNFFPANIVNTATVWRLFGVPIDQVDRHQRGVAKTINFATVYGSSAFGISSRTELTPAEAQVFLDQYFETYPAIRTYIVSFICALLTSSYFTVRRKVVCCPLSHEMSLNLKFDNLKYLHVSTLQVLLVRLILLIRFCSNKCRCDVFLKVACVAEAILIKSQLRFSLCIQ